MSVVAPPKPRQLWSPRVGIDTQTDRFRRFVNQRRGLDLQDYQQLHKYSCDDHSASQFWVDLIHFVELKAEGNLDYAIPAASSLSGARRSMLTKIPGPSTTFPTTQILSRRETELCRKFAQRETVHRDCGACGAGGRNRYPGLHMGRIVFHGRACSRCTDIVEREER